MVVSRMGDLGDSLSEHRRVGYTVACDEYVTIVLAVGLWYVFGAHEQLSQEYYGQYYTHDA